MYNLRVRTSKLCNIIWLYPYLLGINKEWIIG